MQIDTLEPRQIACLMRTINKHTAYLAHLTGRMHQKGFRANDPFVVAAEEAMVAMEKLKAEAIEAGKKLGVENPYAADVCG